MSGHPSSQYSKSFLHTRSHFFDKASAAIRCLPGAFPIIIVRFLVTFNRDSWSQVVRKKEVYDMLGCEMFC